MAPRRFTSAQWDKTYATCSQFPSDLLVSMLFATRTTDVSGQVNAVIRALLNDRGCIKATKARSTGTIVEVWKAEAIGLTDEAGPWVTVCEHGSSCHHENRDVALAWSTSPETWCETGCRHAAEGRQCPGCGSKRMDFQGDNWICMGCGDEWPCNCTDEVA